MFKVLVEKLNSMRVILASSSPRRREILQCTPLKFEICESNFEENLRPEDYSFSEFVQETAYGKAREVYERLKNDKIKPDLVIGVDTMVMFDGKLYGKPKTKEEAFNTITKLTSSGLPNVVYTGVAIIYRGHIEKFTEVTTVHMLNLSEEEILEYVESGEPMGKAGSYGIQGFASTLVERIEGDHNNVIGLPLFRLTQKLKSIILQSGK